jgi:hypothetical protein
MTGIIEHFAERAVQAIENKGVKPVHDRLEELLRNARRGVEIRKRYAPKTGRKFLAQRREK